MEKNLRSETYSTAEPSSYSTLEVYEADSEAIFSVACDPPPYSAHEENSTTTQPDIVRSLRFFPGLPATNLPYTPIGCHLSKDKTTVTIVDPSLCQDLERLQTFVNKQASLPPRPGVRIHGSHYHRRSEEHVVDFDISIDMISYFFPQEGQKGLNFIRRAEDGQTGIQRMRSQVESFYKDTSTDKTLTISRSVSNWDTAYLSARIRAMILDLNYRGKITVNFPTTHIVVVIRPQKARLLDQVARLGGSRDPKFDVECVWQYASAPPSQDAAERRYNICSEAAWWRKWHGHVRHAVASKTRGRLGQSSWLDYIMVPEEKINPAPWGMDN